MLGGAVSVWRIVRERQQIPNALALNQEGVALCL
jgi:hypothetical protein